MFVLGAGATLAEAPAPKKIVLIGGPPDGHPPAAHEYAAATRLIQQCLDDSPNLKAANPAGLAIETYSAGWPEDDSTLDAADAIVFVTSGADHVESNHPLVVGNHLARVERQMRRGCGIATIHYSTFLPARVGPRALDWIGGYFDYQSGPQANGWFSKIKHWKAALKPAADHPISRGVEPFEIADEFYYNIRFRDNDSRRTSILTTRPPGESDDYAVAWAVEREDHGRGFGFTGGHALANWSNSALRRLLLNAIVWVAGADVPPGGVDSALPDEKAKIRAVIVTGHQRPGHRWRETTPALEAALAADPRFATSVQQDIEFLARPELEHHGVVVLNYCNWERPGPSDAAKANLIRYLKRGGGLAIIHFANGAFHFSLPNAAESDWPEWREKICPRVWDHSIDPATHAMRSGHDAHGPFRVEIAPATHPITRGMRAFDTTDELYYRQQGAAPAEVLATAHSKVTGHDEPIALAHRQGNGRVFQSLLGHDAAALTSPGAAQLTLRGVIWAAGAETGVAAPLAEKSAASEKATPPRQAEPAKPIAAKPIAANTVGEPFHASLDATAGPLEVKPNAAYAAAPFTVELSARLDSAEHYNVLVAQSSKDSAEHWELFTMPRSGRLAAYLPGYAPDHVNSETSITDGQWHYLAMTFDGSRARLHVDARPTAEAALRRARPAGEVGPLWIGGYPPGAIRCQGRLDDLRFSSIARVIGRAPKVPFAVDPQTVALWRFDTSDSGRYFDVVHRALAAAPVHKAEKLNDRATLWKEADSQDDRLNLTDTGPFFSGMIQGHEDVAVKGIAIRLGDHNEAAVAYDNDLLRMSCGWRGKFLKFNGFRHGLLRPAEVDGEILFHAAHRPGWGAMECSTIREAPRLARCQRIGRITRGFICTTAESRWLIAWAARAFWSRRGSKPMATSGRSLPHARNHWWPGQCRGAGGDRPGDVGLRNGSVRRCCPDRRWRGVDRTKRPLGTNHGGRAHWPGGRAFDGLEPFADRALDVCSSAGAGESKTAPVVGTTRKFGGVSRPRGGKSGAGRLARFLFARRPALGRAACHDRQRVAIDGRLCGRHDQCAV